METKLNIYNTLSRRKEVFEPVNPPFVGIYVCGPTVYGDAHLGHARPAITFDLVFRYLQYLGRRQLFQCPEHGCVYHQIAEALEERPVCGNHQCTR